MYIFHLLSTELIVIFAFTVSISKWLWSRRKLYIVSRKIPGPFSLPIVGNVQMIYQILKEENPFNTLRKYYKKYSGLYRGWLGPDLFIIAIKPEDVESVFCKSVVAKPPKLAWGQAMGNGLITMTASEKESPWKEHKKIVNPSFYLNLNKYYYEFVRRNSIKLLDEIEKVCDKGLFEIGMILQRFCSDCVTEAMYGVEINFYTGKRDEVFDAVETLTDSVYRRLVHFWNQISFIYNHSELGRRQRAATQVMKNFCKEMHDVKKTQHNNNVTIERPEIPIELLMKAEREGLMTENDVVEEMMNLWNAASDTTGITIQFAILNFAMHKEYQDRAFQEIKQFYKDDQDAVIDYKDLGNFPYLEMCLKESLRLFSPGPIAVRYATEDFKFKSKDITVPANTTLVISSFLTHRDPSVWDKPEEFIPERFSPEESAKRHPFSFYPFSGGPRKCSGRSFGMMLVMTGLVHLLRKYEFQSDWKLKDLPLKFDIDVRSEWGYKTKILKRKWD